MMAIRPSAPSGLTCLSVRPAAAEERAQTDPQRVGRQPPLEVSSNRQRDDPGLFGHHDGDRVILFGQADARRGDASRARG
jgi:hypothetical protein